MSEADPHSVTSVEELRALVGTDKTTNKTTDRAANKAINKAIKEDDRDNL